MSAELMELNSLLNKELGIFKHILNLEESKQDAILKRNPAMMENFCREQEKYLKDINPLEESRHKISSKIKSIHPEKELSLKEIAELYGSGNSAIIRTGEELKSILGKIKSIQETNTRLIKDNLDLFSSIMSELKGYNADDDGFGTKKSALKQAKPLLMDRKF